jgi:deoxycytidine triphosphate deaminase
VAIKSDRWIKRMAEEHGMIEPFAADQVRGGVISYGLSSYGYDMRIADEFKVFTNVFNTLVDPKNFDPRSFVDIKADHCDIPPNSFALARSVELFRIPRNVLSIVLGKSTYARCFSADTRVALLDGTSMSLEELAEQWEQGKHYWGYSVGSHGRIIVTLLEQPRYIGRDSLLAVTLDNGATIRCTPDHEFILRDGQLRKAGDLRPNDSLMPLYRELFRGYEGVYQPINGYYCPTHLLADEWNVRHGIYEDLPGTHRHHVDHDRRNNMPWNIVRMLASDHIRYHNAAYYDSPDFDAQAHGEAISDALQRRMQDPEWKQAFYQSQSERARQFWNDPRYADVRAALVEQRQQRWNDPAEREKQRQRLAAYWSLEERRVQRSRFSTEVWARDDGTRRARQAEIARDINLRPEITAERVLWALNTAGSIRGAARLLECDRTVFRRFPDLISGFRGTPGRNHKITGVEELAGLHDVYCLTVPEAGNFALEAGVFVRNCGLIVNVTPLEPAWEGYVTIEVSNTTPLPARIYANEGIAQVLFLESDEECMVSYADKAGKYQNQHGVVPPRL